MLSLNRDTDNPIYLQLYSQIKNDIIAGMLNPGAKLRSERHLAVELNVSRNTVDLAYQQLLAEGFVVSRPRAGYFVDAAYKDSYTLQDANICIKQKKKAQIETGLYDFACDFADVADVPCREWKKLTNLCFSKYEQELTKPREIFGEFELRNEIKKLLYHYRNIDCDVSQILVAGDIFYCIDLLCRVFNENKTAANILVEDPCDNAICDIFAKHGSLHAFKPVDNNGATVAHNTENLTAYYLTASYQFPTGIISPLDRLQELAEHAERNGYYLIENDYNSCFYSGRRPLPALKSLAKENVVYLGNFSEFLCPCINVAFMVIPEILLEKIKKHLHSQSPLVPYLIQKPLELMMAEGYFERHLRKINKKRREKGQFLLKELKRKFGSSIQITAQDSEAYILLAPCWQTHEAELIKSADNYGVKVYSTQRYWHLAPTARTKVLLGYRGMTMNNIAIAVKLLHAAWSPQLIR